MYYVSYEQALDNLMYLMMCTMFDIALSLGKLSRYMSNLGKICWKTMKLILMYFNSIVHYGLLFDDLLDKVKILLNSTLR